MPCLYDDSLWQAFAANGYVPTLTFTPLHPQTALLNSHPRYLIHYSLVSLFY